MKKDDLIRWRQVAFNDGTQPMSNPGPWRGPAIVIGPYLNDSFIILHDGIQRVMHTENKNYIVEVLSEAG